MSSSCYRKIHLLRFINCYCTSIYKKYVNLLGFIFPSSQNSAYLTNNYHKTLLITQISNQFRLWYFQRLSFTADTESTPFSKDSTAQTQQTKKDTHIFCLLSHRQLCLYWLPIIPIKNLKLCFIQTNILANSFQYITRYWHSRPVNKPSILSSILEETKFNCDIKLLISSGEYLFRKSILHYLKGLKSKMHATKRFEIED